MELKLYWYSSSDILKPVLIVPLWNWNVTSDLQGQSGQISFNRTFMELKYTFSTRTRQAYLSFNRTFMELKSAGLSAAGSLLGCFNRTFMELK